MAKITPKFRTVLLFIFLTGSYLNTYANYTSSILNFLDIETRGEPVIVPDRLNISKIPALNEILNSQVFIDNSIDNKIAQLFTNQTLKSRIQNKILGQNLIEAYFKFSTNLFSYFSTASCDGDTINPTITAPATVNLTTNNACTATAVNLGTPTTGDNCSVASVVNNHPSTTYSLGNTTVVWTVTDDSGNTATANQLVTVTDNIVPTISAPATVNATTNNACTATGIILGTPTTGDNCSIASVVNNHPSTTYSLGNTTVVWTVTDRSGNTAIADQIVSVTDNIEPTISAPATVNATTNTGCNASGVILGTPTTGDNCSVATVTNDYSSTTYPLGNTTVHWTVTDGSGNTATADQMVTVTDNIEPTISPPATVNVTTNTGCNATGVALGTPTTADNCSVATVTHDHSSTTFPLGNTTVRWTVTDGSGNTATADQIVTVTDNIEPTISAPATVNVTTNTGCNATGVALGTPTTADNCSVATVTNDHSTTSYLLGNTTVIWTVTDGSGNTATANQIVTVTDNIIPTISAPATVNATTNSGCNATGVILGIPTTGDNCSVATVSNDHSSTTYFLGNTTVIWTVTDGSGNTKTDTQTVTVTDNEPPAITPNSDLSVNNDVGLCGAFVTIIAATASDNCTVGTPAGTRNDGKTLTAIFPVGLTTISWTVTDTNGNIAIPIEQTVTVLDKEAPVVPVLEDIIWGCEYTLTPPVANDNCAGTITGTTTSALTYSTAGTYTITWTFNDGAGNSSTATQQITIDQLKVDVEQTNILCYGFATGKAEALVTGGVGPFTYDWGSLGTGPSKDGLNPGSYSVTVKDKNGCSATKSFTITQPGSFIEITNVEINKGCFGANNAFAVITASGGTGTLNYSWSNGQSGPKAINLAPGDYTVTVTDENNCSKVTSVKIIAPSQLVIDNISTTETTSFGSATGTATVNFRGGTPGYTFLWSNGQTGQTARDLVAGTYDVIVTDANGCKTAKKIVKIYNSLYTEIEASAICATRTDEIRTSYFEAINTKGGSGIYTFSWSFGDAKTATGPGQHTVKYISSCQKTIILTLTDNDPGRLKPDGSKFTYTSTIIIYAGECFGKCGSEDLRTGEVYLGNVTGLPYNVTQNCELVTNEALWINLTEPGGSRRYDFYTEYVVLLYHPDGTVTEYSSLGQCTPGLIDQNKPLKITDIDYKCGDRISVEKIFMSVSANGNGCNSYTDGPKCNASDKPIAVVTPLSGAAKGGELLCNGASNGKITATASGGQGRYQFTIKSTTTAFTFTSGFQTGGQYIFENLKAGTYNVIIKDEAGRTYTISNVKIIQPSNPLQLIEVSRKPLTCNGGNNAEATVNASGGTAPYIYVWKNGQTTKTAINLSAGPNEVKVIDKNGCEVPLIIDIIQPPILVANAGPDQILKCGVTQVNLSAVFNPYTNPATGLQEFGEWTVVNGPVGSNFADINNPENLFTIQTPGTYTLRWTVPCGATDDVKITISNCSTIDFDGIDDHIDFGDNFNPSGNFTFEAWIKQNTNATAGTKTILSKRDLSNLGTGFDLIIENSFPKFRWNNSEIIASNAIGKDRWYHLAVISNSAGTKLYVDGINVGSGAAASPVSNNFKFLTGAMYDSGTALNPKNYFHGWIEEVRIWKTALTVEQLRFMMNQRIKANGSKVSGVEIPMNVPGNLAWVDLKGYYQMEKVTNGFTIGETASAIKGKLINIITTQERTAPLPYISAKAGLWFDDTTWLHPQVWDAPNSKGINTDTINWNIARISHNINSGRNDITVLGLLSKSAKLTIAKPGTTLDEKNSGQSLTITHYLELNGNIDLVGESQLLQTEGSVLEGTSSGFIERDQQGTANSYNYNYWSSPVSLQGAAIPNNSGYTIGSVMLDGTNSATPLDLSFHDWYEYADGAYSTPRKISDYWLYKFRGTSNVYSEWEHVGSTGPLKAGEGYTMKGTSGGAKISDRQNYVFKGKPNNGNITLTVGQDQNYLLGNPYPSALDADQFIKDNLKDGGTNPVGNIFNGALYFWDHFAGKTHILADYIGGYATYNLSGGVPAVATDERINNTGQSSRDYFGDEAKIPQRYIPVAQGFFINTVLDPILSPTITVVGGNVLFKNSQRAFIKETNPGNSQFLRPEINSKKDKQADSPSKIRLDFKSPMGYNRQILVGTNPNTTNGFDLGYDAPLNDNNPEDMFWLIDNVEFVIQGVPNFGIDQVLPLGIKINEAGEFSIKLNKLENVADDVNIYLKNLQDSTYFDLREGDYSMNLDPGYYNEYFQIVFQKEIVASEEPDPVVETEEETTEEVIVEEEQEQGELETAGEEEILDGEIKVFYVGNNRELAVLNPSKFEIERIVIYDMLGQIIQEYQNVSNEKDVRLPVREFPAAVYAIKLYSGNKEISKSIILIR